MSSQAFPHSHLYVRLLLESGSLALMVLYPVSPCRAHAALGQRLGFSLFLTTSVEPFTHILITSSVSNISVSPPKAIG